MRTPTIKELMDMAESQKQARIECDRRRWAREDKIFEKTVKKMKMKDVV